VEQPCLAWYVSQEQVGVKQELSNKRCFAWFYQPSLVNFVKQSAQHTGSLGGSELERSNDGGRRR